jgi:hypothetical protein
MNHIPSATLFLGPDGWHKPWSGHNGGSCIEVKPLPGKRYALLTSSPQCGGPTLSAAR